MQFDYDLATAGIVRPLPPDFDDAMAELSRRLGQRKPREETSSAPKPETKTKAGAKRRQQKRA